MILVGLGGAPGAGQEEAAETLSTEHHFIRVPIERDSTQIVAPEYWPHAWLRNLIDTFGRGHLYNVPMDLMVVVPDVHFANEATMIRRLGGWLIRVDRSSPSGEEIHASETDLATWDRWDDVWCHDGIADLQARVRAWWHEVTTR